MRTPIRTNGYKWVRLDIAVSSAPLQRIAPTAAAAFLWGDEGIALIPHLNALAGLFADLGQFGRIKDIEGHVVLEELPERSIRKIKRTSAAHLE